MKSFRTQNRKLFDLRLVLMCRKVDLLCDDLPQSWFTSTVVSAEVVGDTSRPSAWRHWDLGQVPPVSIGRGKTTFSLGQTEADA